MGIAIFFSSSAKDEFIRYWLYPLQQIGAEVF